MTRDEAFALHMADLWNDAVNNHTGLLRPVAARLSPEVKDEVHDEVKAFLERQVDTLRKKLARAMEDIKLFVGGEDKWRALRVEDFHADCSPAAHGWKPEKESS